MVQRLSPFVLLCVVVAAVTTGSARAAGSDATTTTTAAATTTTASTTTTATSYAALPLEQLPAGCVGAAPAAVVLPAHPVIALGSPGASLGPSAYFTASGTVVGFDSATASGSTCASQALTLGSVSLFGGAVTASAVRARDGKGTTDGLEIDGVAVSAAPGAKVDVDGWGRLTLGGTVGRVTAPLVLRLLQPHGSLPAGAVVAVGYAAAPRPVAKASPQAANAAQQSGTTQSAPAGKPSTTSERASRARRLPDFPGSRYPFLVGGALGPALRKNPVLSIAMRYLGVPYRWGGASPKSGFDCSGLVMYVFAQLGVALPHFAAAQWHSPDAIWVRPSRLQPGDLVFFVGSDGTRKEPGHVGIYVGDGYLIDAPHTGAFVEIDNLRRGRLAKQYVGAKRIVSPLQLVRHLTTSTAGPHVSAIARGFAPMPFADPGASPGIGVADAGVLRSGLSHGYRMSMGVLPRSGPSVSGGLWTWVGGLLGGMALLGGAGVAARRHRRLDPSPGAAAAVSDAGGSG